LARRERGRATASHPISLGAIAGVVLAGLWLGGMLISASLNAGDLRRSHALVQALEQDGNDAARLRDLLALQERIERYETRRRDYLSILAGFGLNRDRDTLQALWTRYTSLSRTLLVQPVQLSLEASLRSLSRMRADMPPGRDTQRHNYELLKAYLMLGEPRRVEPAFLAQQLASAWPMVTGLSPGAWQDTAQRLATFFAQHLPAHPAWRVDASASLIAATRRLLVNQVDLANADDAVYHALLDRARGMYADVSLPMLLHGADAQGLFTTTQTVPGVYTRAAWEGMVADAIDKAASEQRVQDDWVLRGEIDTSTAQAGSHDAAALKQRLTARYFADYAAAWQHMLNSIQWQTPTTLNAAIDQLTRLTDAQTSPLIALMRAVQEQAQAGRPRQALADTLVSRAQSLMGRDINGQALAPTLSASPLDTAFGPLLALMGDARAGLRQDERDGTAGASPALGGISLQSYLTDATALRLTLQQIASSPDASAMARETVQAVFQGKLSTLAQIREQAALTAASVGSSWAGAGQALFARPIDAAWQTILQPAAASLNDLWRTSIAVPFNTAFDGRYPFFDTDADASFAELSRYVRPDTGLITQFLATQLGGVLNRQGDQWMPNGLAPSTLPLDPAFLQAMQQLTALGTQLCAQGDAGYRFEIMALPTPNVARTTLTIDQQQIAYFNQMQTWTPLRWPGDGLSGRASLVWQTLDATPRSAFNASGDWAFLRLLARAQVKPLDSTRYALTWQEPDAEPLRYVLRTQVGEGPLALLQLRGFTMPERVFKVKTNATAAAAPPFDTIRRGHWCPVCLKLDRISSRRSKARHLYRNSGDTTF
jgi:type VI secretion system protein ImpL